MSESSEMYLKTILELRNEDEPVAISRVAKRLGVSAVSANEMIKRLVEQGTVEHTPYKGVDLTAEGYGRALSVVRRHRLWERFLVDYLEVPWAEAHDPACQLEHATPDEITEALANFLDNPLTCPHGNEIPAADGTFEPVEAIPLNEIEIGGGGRIARIYPEETTLLEHLNKHDICPGKQLVVEDVAPYNGPLTIVVDGETVVIGRTVAAHVYVQVS
jgi:DtxR family Mn-dependent transcriptional regulator